MNIFIPLTENQNKPLRKWKIAVVVTSVVCVVIFIAFCTVLALYVTRGKFNLQIPFLLDWVVIFFFYFFLIFVSFWCNYRYEVGDAAYSKTENNKSMLRIEVYRSVWENDERQVTDYLTKHQNWIHFKMHRFPQNLINQWKIFYIYSE